MACIYKKPTRRKDPKTGEMVRVKSKKWWGRYRDSIDRDRRVPLSTDKRAAQAMLDQIVTREERKRAGLIDTAHEQMKRPIRKHVEEYLQHLEAKNNTEEYVRSVNMKLGRIIEELKWQRISDIKAVDMERFLCDLRNTQGRSVATSNHYLRAAKGFARWLVNNERLYRNPLISLSLLNTRTDRRHDRRALSQEEFRRLIEAAETGPPVEGLSGRTRAMIYRVAAWTGLRKGEIDSLTPRSFRLDADPPTVKVEASWSKRRRRDTQILHPDLVVHLRPWCERFEPNELMFPMSEASCGFDRKGAKMMRADLEAARNLWLAEDETLREERERSDFLKYRDQDGRFADFHSLRHTFITNLIKANVSPKVAQTLARHSDIRLTMDIYTHVDQDEQKGAIGRLPEM